MSQDGSGAIDAEELRAAILGVEFVLCEGDVEPNRAENLPLKITQNMIWSSYTVKLGDI